MNGKGWWGLVAVLGLLGAFGQWRFFGPIDEGKETRVAAIAHDFGPWHGEDVQLDERTYEILETRNVLYREYRTQPDSPRVDLCIVFSQANRKAPHPPEVCYTGAGAHVDRRPPETLEWPRTGQPIQGNSLLVMHRQSREVVLYWYLAGSRLMTSYYGQQLAIMWAQLTGRPSQSALIRFSTPIVNESSDQAMVRLRSFALTTLPVILDGLAD